MKKKITNEIDIDVLMKRIDDLQQELTLSRGVQAGLAKNIHDATAAASAAEAREKETRNQFNDLKWRLHDAEVLNAQLHGYLMRIQEDDVVREELVTVGDPEGEQRMKPKRQHTDFPRFQQHRPDDTPSRQDYMRYARSAEEERPRKPKHWITYGTP